MVTRNTTDGFPLVSVRIISILTNTIFGFNRRLFRIVHNSGCDVFQLF